LSATQMLEKFLFTSETQWNIIEKLSGGERRRLFLLRIIMEAPNIIILDEPTNDLDIQTLTILEDYLENFKGAVITVSHDRYFLDKVVNCIFQFENDGSIKQYLGCYSNYFEQISTDIRQNKDSIEKNNTPKVYSKNKKLKFTFNEQREYENIDDDIAKIENELENIDKEIPECSTDFEVLQQLLEKKAETEKLLSEKMERWVYLTELSEKIANDK
ncbi:MAG: ATP-binding cassette domain-containing protein, partial [Oscillospiraceae bacterium]